MYAAKARGRNNFQFFTQEMNRISDERLQLEAAMRVALEQDGFSVAFQPKVDHRRQIVGAEVSARWHTADFGHGDARSLHSHRRRDRADRAADRHHLAQSVRCCKQVEHDAGQATQCSGQSFTTIVS